ncbi:MAG: hypothetical protein SV775_12085 [Thermodesulfobacteriota bacterium]|nr:hypothetical protein [Thermodesulfobacteriota bacterium]
MSLRRDIEVHKDNPDFKEGIWAIIEIDISRLTSKPKGINTRAYRTTNPNFTIP